MRRTTVLWETYVMRFEDGISRYGKRRLTVTEAGELLGMSERHFRRLCGRSSSERAPAIRQPGRALRG